MTPGGRPLLIVTSDGNAFWLGVSGACADVGRAVSGGVSSSCLLLVCDPGEGRAADVLACATELAEPGSSVRLFLAGTSDGCAGSSCSPFASEPGDGGTAGVLACTTELAEAGSSVQLMSSFSSGMARHGQRSLSAVLDLRWQELPALDCVQEDAPCIAMQLH